MVASKSYKQNASTVVVESNAFSTDQCSITESSVKVNGAVKSKTQYSAFNDYGNPETVKEYIGGNNCITTTYSYNDTNGYKGLLTSSTKDGVTVSYEYDIMGRNTKQTNGKNGVTTYTYDTMGSLTSATSPKGNKETYKYDYQANTIQYTDAKGNVTSYDYDSAGNLLTVKSGDDTLATYTYDNSMMCVSEKVGDSLTKYGYDCLYRLASMTVRDAADTKTYKKETYAYAGSDISTPTTTTITLSEGTGSSLKTAIEDSTVNDCGWITEKYDYSKGLNGTKPIYKYEYDYLGNPVKVEANTAGNNTTDGPYAAATYEYDYAGRVTRETDSLGGVKEYTYDQLGRKTAEKDKNGNTSTFTYDAYNRLTLSSAPLEGSSYMKQRYTYDANGNVIKEETLNSAVGASESWAVTNYTYDADNNLTRAESIDTDSKKYYTTYGYDANGNTTRVTSANGKNATDYVYDKYNRVTKMTDPMGYVETYTYDIAGNMTSKTDRNGNVIRYTYDPANRLTKEYSGNTVRAEYTYDLAGNKIQETNSNITVKSTYNKQNRLSTVNITKPGENNIIKLHLSF